MLPHCSHASAEANNCLRRPSGVAAQPLTGVCPARSAGVHPAAGLLGRVLLAGLVLPGLAAAGPDGSQSQFMDLFNGRDLTGWVVEGTKQYTGADQMKPIWSVNDGVLSCAGKGFGFLRYEKEFSDFVLHVEYRMSPKGNSGIGIRTVPYVGSFQTRPSMAGYEIQLLDDAGKPPDTHSTGSLYRYVAPTANPVKAAPEWNTMEIECVGPRIRVTLNGQRIQDVDQKAVETIKNKPLRGFVCLQNHGRPVSFRHVRIKELSSTASAAQAPRERSAR